MADKYYVLPEYSAILSVVDAIFHHLNHGLLIYHLENPDRDDSLRLIYANQQASRYTGTDLQNRVGKPILQAFPGLAKGTLVADYAAVARTNRSRELGRVEYVDGGIEPSSYTVKAFPMPGLCVGVLFESSDPR